MSDTTFLLHKTIRRLPPLSRKHLAFLFDDLFSVTPYSLWGGLQHVRHLPGFGTSHSWSLFFSQMLVCSLSPLLRALCRCHLREFPELPRESSPFHFLLALITLSYFTCCLLAHLSPIFKLVSSQLACYRAYGAVCFVYRLSLVPRIVPGTLRALIHLY